MEVVHHPLLHGSKIAEPITERVPVEVVHHPLLDRGEIPESVAEGVPVEPVHPTRHPLLGAEVSKSRAERVPMEAVHPLTEALMDGDALVDGNPLVDWDPLVQRNPLVQGNPLVQRNSLVQDVARGVLDPGCGEQALLLRGIVVGIGVGEQAGRVGLLQGGGVIRWLEVFLVVKSCSMRWEREEEREK